MKKYQKISITTLRLFLGWLFFYAGITKVLDPSWSAGGYLSHAKTFPEVYAWFASEANIWWVNILNEWGLTLIGLALITGLFVRYASIGGILLMTLYYFPILSFPYAGDHSYIVDEHIIYIVGFAVLIVFEAGKYFSLGKHLHWIKGR